MALTKILVANRGEIACRVMETARRMGCRTVAVYSEADRAARHVTLADEAVLLGPAPVGDSYLSVEKVIAAARRAGADAIHPGYGFLSENADFARACAAAGITFIGPPADTIELMGNKRAAKIEMLACGVPCVPGYQGAAEDDGALFAEAERIGYPVMVKAAAGGGGRGMRLVHEPAELQDALRAARAEALSAFGSAELILEKAIAQPRHIEIQVFADTFGNIVHLGERDCSVQRRHQKVIEECPSPAVDEPLRQRMGLAAVEAARACGYVGAGTVEFLLDAPDATGERPFYFLEMNTRLQVEHPVTEMVTGIDLVEWQIRVAQGEPLPLEQGEIRLQGHAIEARLYAEDPRRGFMPQTGRIAAWRPPPGSDVRIDHGLGPGAVVSPHYDPMLAKVIAHGCSREQARTKLASALRDLTVLGSMTNKAFLIGALSHPAFVEGAATTAFVDEHLADHPTRSILSPSLWELGAATMAVVVEGARGLCEDESYLGWKSGGPIWSALRLAADEGAHEVTVRRVGSGAGGGIFEVRREGEAIELELAGARDGELALVHDGARRRVRYALAGEEVWIDDGEAVRLLTNATHVPERAAEKSGSGRLIAPLDGRVLELFVAENDAVERGQLVMVIEAMKMEHRIVADTDGSVDKIYVAAGEQVKTRQLLAEIAQLAAQGEA